MRSARYSGSGASGQRRVRICELVLVLVLGFAVGRKCMVAGLRRAYQRETGHILEESSFYERFTPGLARLLQKLLACAFEESLSVARGLKGPLATFRDVILADSTSSGASVERRMAARPSVTSSWPIRR